MLEVTVAVLVRDNVAEGAIVQVSHTETIAVLNGDESGMWMQAQQALSRLARDEVLPKAEIQLEHWLMKAERRGT